MGIEFNRTAGGDVTYIDIRVDDKQAQHQTKLNASGLAASRNSEMHLPPGLPIIAGGLPVSGASQVAIAIVGPERVKLGSSDRFGNAFLDGVFNRNAIESNLGRVLSANELAAIAAGGFKLI